MKRRIQAHAQTFWLILDSTPDDTFTLEGGTIIRSNKPLDNSRLNIKNP